MARIYMLLFDTARYGRLIVEATVFFSLLACERKSTKPAEKVVAAAKASPLADKSAIKAVPAPTLNALHEENSPSVQEITDRAGPDSLATWLLSTAEWDSLNADCSKRESLCSTTKLGRFRLVEGLEQPRLFYQVAAQDSAWTEIDLALPNEDIDWGMKSARGELDTTELDTVNLDGRGAAELVLRFRPAGYGSGGGTAWDYVSVLDVSSSPMLIFRALLAAEDEAFGGYAAMHGYKMEPGEQFTGCKRSFKVRRRELVLGPVRTIGNTKTGDCTLTKLPAGRYRYQNGRVLHIGK